MKVVAAPGTRCPMEGNPRKFITDAEPVEVSNSVFYKRMVADGSLLEIAAKPTKKKEVTANGQ